MAIDKITQLGAAELAQHIRHGDLSAREVTEAYINRIDTVNPRLNAVVVPMFEQARQAAAQADSARQRGDALGPLHGVPITIKDQFHVKGMATTFGMARLRGNIAGEDGSMVAALRQAGAIILGKTNVPQTLGVVETDNTIWGRTNNPWDLERTPGGSSGGEAAIIAAGGSALGLGGDFGGSVRLPAVWCGIYGLRPTARRLPGDSAPLRTASGAEGLVAQPGPLARKTADVALALRVMVAHIVAHPTSFNPPVPFREPDQVDVSRLRVALLPQIGDWKPSPAIRRALHEAAAVLRSQGATVEEWRDAPNTQTGVYLFFQIVGADSFGWARGLLENEKPIPLMQPSMRLTSMPRAIIPVVAGLMGATGQHHLGGMMRNVQPQSADGLMNILGDRMAYEARFMAALDAGQYDAILCPAQPLPAVRHGDTIDLADFWGSSMLFNTLGMPAGVVPVTRVRADEESDRPVSKDKAEEAARSAEKGSAGLPVGVQIAARHWREDVVLAVMQTLETALSMQPDYPAQPPL